MYSLHAYESVELEFSLTTVDLSTKEIRDDCSTSVVSLHKGTVHLYIIPTVYYSIRLLRSHNAWHLLLCPQCWCAFGVLTVVV